MVKIGILGGIGPESTIDFYTKLIERLQKSGRVKNNTDYPQIIINSVPASDKMTLHSNCSVHLNQYRDGLAELDAMNVDFIVIVCNTIYKYYDELKKNIRAPIIDLRVLLRQELINKSIKSALVLGTETSIKSNVHQLDDIQTTILSNTDLQELSNAIVQFSAGINKSEAASKVKDICKKHIHTETDAVVLGCTELALMLRNEDLGIVKIDVMDCVLDEVMRRL